jgi:DNA-binding transcriptional regulator LsrR (DeoR family)
MERTPTETLELIKAIRSEALQLTRRVAKLHDERRVLMRQLVQAGWSQAMVARELNVSRQAVQKMLA